METVGYFPGVIGKVIELHAVYYFENWGFDVSFETQEGKELSEFMAGFDEKRDGFWATIIDNEFAGCVAIDGNFPEDEGARLRWFIVDPKFQGKGAGSALIREAVDFCKSTGYKRVFLWTFEGLDAARRLYEREGFYLAQEHTLHQWGREINEQMFELILDG
ncbi:GNAT family N-acetyltransferase [Thermodesulfobacteriota bacterium]